MGVVFNNSRVITSGKLSLQVSSIPGIITSGLAVYYNPANISSYPGTGTTMNDLSGNSNTATLSTNTSNLPTYNIGGWLNYANVSGNDAYLNTPAATSINDLSTMTVSMWLKFDLNSALNHTLLYKSDNNGTAGWFMEYSSNVGGSASALAFAVVGPTDARYGIAQSQVTLGVWVNVVATWNGVFPSPTNQFYLNGVLDTSTPTINTTGVGSRTTDAAQPMTFGLHKSTGSSAADFIGDSGVMLIYNRVLTATEILQNFNATRAIYGI